MEQNNARVVCILVTVLVTIVVIIVDTDFAYFEVWNGDNGVSTIGSSDGGGGNTVAKNNSESECESLLLSAQQRMNRNEWRMNLQSDHYNLSLMLVPFKFRNPSQNEIAISLIVRKSETKIAKAFETPQNCYGQYMCYPSHVYTNHMSKRYPIQGVEVKVPHWPKSKPRIQLHARTGEPQMFEMDSMFKGDQFYIRLLGPEIIVPACATSPDAVHKVTYTFRIPGFYKLHIKLFAGNNGRINFNRELWTSPYSIAVSGPTLLPQVAYMPLSVCKSGWDMSQGSWMKTQVAIDNGLVPCHKDKWKRWQYLITRDDYMWIPTKCRLRPIFDEPLRHCLNQTRVCMFGDSFGRTLVKTLFATVAYFNVSVTPFTRQRVYPLFQYVMSSWGDTTNCKEKGHFFVNQMFKGVQLLNRMEGLHESCKNSSACTVTYMATRPWSYDYFKIKRLNADLIGDTHEAARAMTAKGIDYLDFMSMAWPRIDEVCDGTHVACFDRGNLGQWEALLMANVMC